MDLIQLLQTRSAEILSESVAAMRRANVPNYEQAGFGRAEERLKTLLALTVKSLSENDLSHVVQLAEKIARERYESGYDLQEIQTAFNVLEEAIWTHIVKEIPPEGLAHALGLLSTVLGAGKDVLATTYVSLVTKTKAPSLDLQSLFKGTQ